MPWASERRPGRRIVKRSPSNQSWPPPQMGLGRTLVQADPAGAEAAFLAALTEQPNDSAALNDLGIARDMLGRHADAQDAYRKALAVSPEATDVKMNLGLSLALTGDKDAAVGVLKEAAAVPAAVQNRPRELAADLAMAGDQTGASQVLSAGRLQPRDADGCRTETGSAGGRSACRGSPGDAAGTRYRVGSSSVLSLPIVAVARAPRVPVSQAVPEALVDTAAVPAPTPVTKPAAATSPAQPAVAKSTSEKGAYVQLASLHSLDDAWYEWRRLTRRLPELLGSHAPVIVQADALGETYWCLRTFGFDDLAAASALCSEAHGASGLRCWARVAL